MPKKPRSVSGHVKSTLLSRTIDKRTADGITSMRRQFALK